MINLPNGCYCGELSVNPKNWKQVGASTKKNWFIHYRFYDPAQKEKYPKGLYRMVKLGINSYKDLAGRRKVMECVISEHLAILQSGFNPIRVKEKLMPIEIDEPLFEINLTTPLFIALEWARVNATVVDRMKKDIKSQLKFLHEAGSQLNYLRLPIGEVRKKHIVFLLKQVEKNRPIWNNARFNKYRANLQSLFKVLLGIDAVESNIITPIPIKPVVTKIRETLSKAERKLVDDHFRRKKLTGFRLYIRIFFHTGIRSTELLRIKGKDVDLRNQLVKATILKGGVYKEVNKTIKNIAVRYWKLALKNCRPEDYIFSKWLKPGAVTIDENQISQRWIRHVKNPVDKGGLGLSADFYSYKHGNTTEMIDLHGAETAAEQNSHSSTAMVRKIYDVKRVSREHEKIKLAANQY